MDKNAVTGLLLIFALLLGFTFYNSSQNKKKKEQQMLEMEQQAVQQARATASFQGDGKNEVADTLLISEDSLSNASMVRPFSSLQPTETADYVIETSVARYYIAREGGYVSQVELKNIYRNTVSDSAKMPLVLFNGKNNVFNIDLMLKDQTVIHSKDYYFIADTNESFNISQRGQQVCLRLYPTIKNTTDLDKNSYLEYCYTFSPDDYRFHFSVRFINLSPYLYPNKHDFMLDWQADMINVEKNYEYEKTQTSVYYMDNLDEVDNLSERSDDRKTFTTPLKWVAFKQQFFTAVLIADKNPFANGELKVNQFGKAEQIRLKKLTANLDFSIPNIDSSRFDVSCYMGPNQYKLLKTYNLKLERMVPLGWSFFLLHWVNRFAVIPIFNWLENYGLNYGIIILILTIIVKAVLTPVTYKTYLSSARMRVLKPELTEIAQRYPKQEDAMKKQQATMALYKSAGVSPMSGCLPMLFQLPILIAMFRFFPSAFELRQQSFLWADDLSSYDSIYHFGFNIPFYGDHVSLFTLLMTISTLVYTWLNNKLMSPATGNDPSQRMMKVMMYVMPIIFLGMFNSFSSGLTYYYLLVNLITFVQMFIFRMVIDEKKVHARIHENMKKPVKKSKWQLKMEELARQQQQLQKQKR
ncbi:MAG: membrane protein insertase YidC [Bacteroidales bacterium]|jgi:YidC/Oxa1 family membrane protein insertase|nr:membrane protein insertase YidC [Bacteroidales bacterium]